MEFWRDFCLGDFFFECFSNLGADFLRFFFWILGEFFGNILDFLQFWGFSFSGSGILRDSESWEMGMGMRILGISTGKMGILGILRTGMGIRILGMWMGKLGILGIGNGNTGKKRKTGMGIGKGNGEWEFPGKSQLQKLQIHPKICEFQTFLNFWEFQEFPGKSQFQKL